MATATYVDVGEELVAFLIKMAGSSNRVVAEQARAQLLKVGPKGYEHGWVYVGRPSVGFEVHHPDYGHGEVTARDDEHTHVRFESGEEVSFGHEKQDHLGHFKPRDPSQPRPMYHGTVAEDLDQIQPASTHRRGVVFASDTNPDYAYATTDPDTAWHYAEMATHASASGRPRVYVVAPTGAVETDPALDDAGRPRSNFESDVRSRDPFDVLDEISRPPSKRWMDEDDDEEDEEGWGFKDARPDLVKVGPKGYEHGWIYVGPPKVGARVHVPDLGRGTVTRRGKKTTAVRFDSGAEHSFEHVDETPDRRAVIPRPAAAKKPKATPAPAALPGPVKPTATDAIAARLRATPDAQLLDAFREISASPPSPAVDIALRHLDAELARREGVKELTVVDDAHSRQLDDLMRRGWSYTDAYAEVHALDPAKLGQQQRLAAVEAARRKGERRADTIRRLYQEWVYVSWLQAETATRGNLLSKAGRAKGIDAPMLWFGPAARARKYASPELKEWWENNGGRPTLTQWSAQFTGDRRGAQAARLAGSGRDYGI